MGHWPSRSDSDTSLRKFFQKFKILKISIFDRNFQISKDMRPAKSEEEKKLTQGEKRKRRLDPDQCLTTSKVRFLTPFGQKWSFFGQISA